MSGNSSSSTFLQTPPDLCFSSSLNIFLFTAHFFVCILLLLPLFIIVLCIGYQRWSKQHSIATPTAMRHCDVFTFHMVALEMIGVFGSCCYLYGIYGFQQIAIYVGMCIFSIVSPGQTLFHLLTCVERYLAVGHPVTYLGLRQSGGVRIRNISIVCVWLICFGSVGPSRISFYFYVIFTFMLLFVSAVVVSFCSVSVLCILIRPGPGEVGGNAERGDQSKQRAFQTIVAILGVLLLRFFSNLVSIGIYSSPLLNDTDSCLVMLCAVWFSLPSSLVLPLLFIHRAGKLPGCKHNTESD